MSPADEIHVDFTGSESTTFEAIPEGSYECVVTDAALTDSKSSDNQYIKWELTVSGGEYDNRKLWHNTTLTPGKMFALRNMVVACGEDPDALNGAFTLIPERYIGARLKVKVVNEMYEEVMRNKIKRTDRSTNTKALPPIEKSGTPKRRVKK